MKCKLIEHWDDTVFLDMLQKFLNKYPTARTQYSVGWDGEEEFYSVLIFYEECDKK